MATPGAFSFKRGIQDVSGYDHPTAYVGTPTLVAGRFGAGLRCTGGNGFTINWVAGSYYGDLSGGKSIGMWVKAAPGTAGQTRVLYDCGAFKLYLATSNGDVGMFVAGSMFSTGVNVCDNTWHHVLYTYDNVGTGSNANTHRWWIDGVQVASTVRDLTISEPASQTAYVGRAVSGEPANADISDLRIWNDPIHPTEGPYIRDLPVTDYARGIFSFNASANGQFGDAGEGERHLVQGAAGLVAGHTSNGLSVSAPWTTFYSPGSMDRVTMMFWMRTPNLSGLSEILALLSGTTVRARASHGGGGIVTGNFRRDDGTLPSTSSSSGVIAANTWHRVVVQAWAYGVRVMVDGNTVAQGSDGGYPVNTPSFTGISHLRVGAGVVIDDLRIISNWISGEAINRLANATTPDAASVLPLSGIRRGDGARIRIWRKQADGSLVELSMSGFDSASDTAPPSVPASVGAIGTPGATSFVLSWNASVDAGETPDTAAPSVPAGLASSSVGATSFGLNWGESTDA